MIITKEKEIMTGYRKLTMRLSHTEKEDCVVASVFRFNTAFSLIDINMIC